MLIRALCLILSLLMVLPAPAIVSATVYWASSGGSNSANCGDIDSVGTAEAPGSDPGSYGTIGRAAACANTAGDVVNIKAGTYTGTNHKITSGAMFASGSSDSVRTVIQGNPGGAVPQINIPNWFTTDEASSTHRNYFTLQDVSVSGSGGSDGGGGELSIEGAYIIVQRVTITDSYNMNIASFAANTTNNHHHIYRNNSLQDAGSGDGNGYGIYTGAADVTIEGNEVFGGKGACFQVYADGFTVPRPTIRNNYCHDIAKATQASVLNACFGIAVNGADALIYNNILDGAGCGVGASGSGITAGYTTSNVLLAYNNIIINWPSYSIEYGHFAVTSGNEAKNNLMVGNGTNTPNNTSANGSSITTATNKTTGSLTDCTVSTSDFTHRSDSTCRDAGTTVAAVSTDYIGTARPQNSVFDIGAYEYIVVSGGGMSETPSWSSPRKHHLWRR